MTPVVEGYPSYVIPMVLGCGLLLALLRPYGAFLAMVILLTAGHMQKFNQTRLSALGPYLNLTDACLLVALVALFLDRLGQREPIRIPRLVALMFFVLIIASVQSCWKLGFTYGTMRTIRWAFEFPVALFLGANLVVSTDRVRKLVVALGSGAVLAALQHLIFAVATWKTKSLSMETYSAVRTIAYWAGCMGPAFLLTSLVWGVPSGFWRKTLTSAAGLLLLASMLMNQTRSLWLAFAMSIPCLLLLFRAKCSLRNLLRLVAVLGLTFAGSAWALQRAMLGLDVTEIALLRVSSLAEKSEAVSGTATRRRAFEVEMGQYLRGTLIFGRGIGFSQTLENPRNPRKRIAFGHLAYVTYLSQMGLVGLLVYGGYLPLSVLRKGLWLWHVSREPASRYLALLGVASIVCFSIMFVAGAGFLGVGSSAPGVLYGGVWAMASLSRTEPLFTQACDGEDSSKKVLNDVYSTDGLMASAEHI